MPSLAYQKNQGLVLKVFGFPNPAGLGKRQHPICAMTVAELAHGYSTSAKEPCARVCRPAIEFKMGCSVMKVVFLRQLRLSKVMAALIFVAAAPRFAISRQSLVPPTIASILPQNVMPGTDLTLINGSDLAGALRSAGSFSGRSGSLSCFLPALSAASDFSVGLLVW